jgi:hypothetical protein
LFSARIEFDGKDIEQLTSLNIDVEKYIRWYLSQVYQALAKQHSKRWSYITPPASRRSNIYLRTGKLRSDLSSARYIKKISDDEWEAGFNIRPGSYLAIHAGYRDDPPTTITARGSSSLFMGRMAIPLRAALTSNGTAKNLTPRAMNNILILPFHVWQSGQFGKDKKSSAKPMNDRKMLNIFKKGARADFAGEDIHKFHENSLIVCKLSGRKFIPMYVLAHQVKIPKRIFIKEKMDDYYDKLYDKLNDAIEKAMPRP